jgi:hypothetical protein
MIKWQSIKKYLIITLVSILYGAGTSLFLEPNELVPGGLTGISMILNRFIPLGTGTFFLIMNIPIIALSQLNRGSEVRETKEPTMAELREAGDIEQDASVIILMWNVNQDDYSKKGCKIEKNRQGKLGKQVLNFDGDLMKFTESEESLKSAGEWRNADNVNPFN